MGSKSIKNPKKWYPRALRKDSWKQLSQTAQPWRWIWQTFGATRAILGAILGPAGRQGAHKIELFGTKSHQNLKKWGPEWGIKKYMKFWSTFYEKMWDFGCAEPTEMLCLKAFWWLTHILTKSKISWTSMPKWTPKVIPKSTFGRSGVGLLRFWVVFWGMQFFKSFGMCKKSTKNEKSSALGRKRQKSGQLWGGSAAEALVLGTWFY